MFVTLSFRQLYWDRRSQSVTLESSQGFQDKPDNLQVPLAYALQERYFLTRRLEYKVLLVRQQ